LLPRCDSYREEEQGKGQRFLIIELKETGCLPENRRKNRKSEAKISAFLPMLA
jgi:hypothetical protein